MKTSVWTLCALARHQTQGVISARNGSTVTAQGSGENVFDRNKAKFGGGGPWLVVFGAHLELYSAARVDVQKK